MVGDNTTITYIADSEERRDKWIEAFHTLVNRKIDKHKEKYDLINANAFVILNVLPIVS